MPVQQWEVNNFQAQAEEMCRRLGEDPNQMLMDANGFHFPRWMNYATRMAEFRVMVEVMRNFGAPI